MLAELRRSPPAVPVGRSPRQGHHCVRLHRGKPLRTLYQGESHLRARNRSPEFTRPRRSAPPHRNPPSPATFRLFLSTLGSGRCPARTLPRRSGLATASSAAVPPCTPAGALRPSSSQAKGTLGCASLRGARWCSPRGRRPHRRRDPLVGGALPLGHADQWGRGPTVSCKGTEAGRDLGAPSVFQCGFEMDLQKMFSRK